MRRVSEGFLVGEDRVREALMSLLNGLAGFGSTRSYPKIPLNPPLKNFYVKHFCDPAGIALRMTGNEPHSSTAWNHPVLAKHGGQPFEWTGQRAYCTRHGLLPWDEEEFIAEAKSNAFVRSVAEGRR